jgi:hypothetical protein
VLRECCLRTGSGGKSAENERRRDACLARRGVCTAAVCGAFRKSAQSFKDLL